MGIDLKEAALQYSEHGFNVGPVIGKALRASEWQNLTTEDFMKPQHEWLWEKATGLGLILGESSGVIAFDLDLIPETEEEKELYDKIISLLPPIKAGRRGNPKKRPTQFFKYNGEPIRHFENIHVDILSKGSYTVIPPAKHPDFKDVYFEWVETPLTEIDADDLPDLPDGLIEELEKLDEIERLRLKEDELPYNDGTSVGLKTTGTMEAPRCKSGSHNRLSSVAVAMFFNGEDFDSIVERVKELDQFINKEAKAVKDNPYKYYFECPTRKWPKENSYHDNAEMFVREIFERHKDEPRRSKDDYFKDEIAQGFTVMDPTKRINGYQRKYFTFYDFLRHKHHIAYIPEMKQFMFYDGMKFNRLVDEEIKALVQKYFKYPRVIKQGERSTFLDLAKSQAIGQAKDYLRDGYYKANFLNGTYCLREKKLRPHSPDDRMNILIPSEFKSGGKTPVWDRLMDNITLKRPTHKLAIEEFIGYSLVAAPYTKFNKFLILDGKGSNGKSTLIRIIKELIGEGNFSATSLSDVTSNRFSGANLINKLVNFCNEEPKEAFASTGPLKKITGGDPMMAEEKNKGAFPHTAFAKFIISYNEMPFFPDASSGMTRRIIMIRCEQNFERREELKIKDVEKKILGSEKEALIYKCIKAFEAVMERGAFTEPEGGMERVKEMIVASNAVRGFISDCVVFTGDEKDSITVDLLFTQFENYVGPRHKYTKNGFGREFKKIVNELEPKGVSLEKKGIKLWMGLRTI